MNVGFYYRKLESGGGTVAFYDYAYYNQKILNNNSFIITTKTDEYQYMRSEFEETFGKIHYVNDESEVKGLCEKLNITHLYSIKFGKKNDGICDLGPNIKLLVHCVFDSTTPHGDRCAVVGNTINKIFGTNLPVVGHVVRLPEHSDKMELNIPPGSIVFGRYGSKASFDIPFVHEVIKYIVNNFSNIYFIFMNTNKFYEHPNIRYVEETTSLYEKRRFINSCDVLLHARGRGETFGLTCGEFAICKKPVITYGGSFETEHMDILGDKCIKYYNPQQLFEILVNFKQYNIDMTDNGYMKYTPEAVMERFKNIFFL